MVSERTHWEIEEHTGAEALGRGNGHVLLWSFEQDEQLMWQVEVVGRYPRADRSFDFVHEVHARRAYAMEVALLALLNEV